MGRIVSREVDGDDRIKISLCRSPEKERERERERVRLRRLEREGEREHYRFEGAQLGIGCVMNRWSRTGGLRMTKSQYGLVRERRPPSSNELFHVSLSLSLSLRPAFEFERSTLSWLDGATPNCPFSDVALFVHLTTKVL